MKQAGQLDKEVAFDSMTTDYVYARPPTSYEANRGSRHALSALNFPDIPFIKRHGWLYCAVTTP
jgi:hypothetical protein